MYRSLNEYIARLEREGELVRIGAPVSPVEEIAEITDRISKTPGGGKALLFDMDGVSRADESVRLRTPHGAGARRRNAR